MSSLFKFKDDLKMKDRLILFASELCGTAILLFLGCISCVEGIAHGTHLTVAFAFGLAVMASVQIFGHISGCHINPAVTTAAFIFGKIAAIEIPVYFIAQFIGAFAGYGLLMAATPPDYQIVTKRELATNGTLVKIKVCGICSPLINPIITALEGLLVEFLLTLILVWFCCGIWDPRNENKVDSVPIKFGLAITVLALTGGPYSGAHMNPARSLAPAVWHGDFKDHWIFWVGPLLAAIVGAALYRLIFLPSESADGE